MDIFFSLWVGVIAGLSNSDLVTYSLSGKINSLIYPSQKTVFYTPLIPNDHTVEYENISLL